jgi:hypothetical protein
MFRAGETQHRVVNSYEKIRMGSFETPPERSFVQILDDVIADELPKLAR